MSGIEAMISNGPPGHIHVHWSQWIVLMSARESRTDASQEIKEWPGSASEFCFGGRLVAEFSVWWMTLICYSSTKQANTELKQSNSPANEAGCGCQLCSAFAPEWTCQPAHSDSCYHCMWGEDQRKDIENNSDKVFWSPNPNNSFMWEQQKIFMKSWKILP